MEGEAAFIFPMGHSGSKIMRGIKILTLLAAEQWR